MGAGQVKVNLWFLSAHCEKNNMLLGPIMHCRHDVYWLWHVWICLCTHIHRYATHVIIHTQRKHCKQIVCQPETLNSIYTMPPAELDLILLKSITFLEKLMKDMRTLDLNQWMCSHGRCLMPYNWDWHISQLQYLMKTREATILLLTIYTLDYRLSA